MLLKKKKSDPRFFPIFLISRNTESALLCEERYGKKEKREEFEEGFPEPEEMMLVVERLRRERRG